MSWNHLRRRGAVALCEGLRVCWQWILTNTQQHKSNMSNQWLQWISLNFCVVVSTLWKLHNYHNLTKHFLFFWCIYLAKYQPSVCEPGMEWASPWWFQDPDKSAEGKRYTTRADLTCNRIDTTCLDYILRGLKLNSGLHCLRVRTVLQNLTVSSWRR